MKTTLIPLLALALAAGTALADSHGGGPKRAERKSGCDTPCSKECTQRREHRGERREGRGDPQARRGGEGRWAGPEHRGGPISDEMRQVIRDEHRAIKELADAARAETDETRQAELVDQLRLKLGEVADRIQAHREERLAQAEERLAGLREQIEQAKANRDEMVEEHLQRILAGERPLRPAAYNRFPHAKGGRGDDDGPGRGPRGRMPPPPPPGDDQPEDLPPPLD